MARDLDTNFKNEITSTVVRPAMMVQFKFESGDLNMWTGYGDLLWNDITFTGAGTFLGVSPIEESQDLRATTVTFTLSGITSSIISSALNSNYQGRDVTMWFAVVNDSGALIGTPYELFSGRMDIISFSDDAEVADFAIKCESNAIDIRKAKERRYTPEDQKIDYPDDKGLEFIPKIQDIDVVWG
jgi:hypothetical protein|tara:strand:- start:28 stop:582 length:555 start_codon:yes stop_codon:yes gene_type:complete